MLKNDEKKFVLIFDKEIFNLNNFLNGALLSENIVFVIYNLFLLFKYYNCDRKLKISTKFTQNVITHRRHQALTKKKQKLF